MKIERSGNTPYCIAIVLALIITFILMQFDNTDYATSAQSDRLHFISQGANGRNEDYIIVDTYTGVCYPLARHGYKVGLTMMVDSAGNPLIYNGYE